MAEKSNSGQKTTESGSGNGTVGGVPGPRFKVKSGSVVPAPRKRVITMVGNEIAQLFKDAGDVVFGGGETGKRVYPKESAADERGKK